MFCITCVYCGGFRSLSSFSFFSHLVISLLLIVVDAVLLLLLLLLFPFLPSQHSNSL